MEHNNCCMPGCKNNITKLNKNHNSDITYHRFPRRNNDLRQKWIKACGRVGWEPDINEKLCSKHFQHSDFCQYGRPGRLRRDAVPTSCVDDYESCREELSSLREMIQCTQMFVSKQSRETSEKRAWSVQPAVLTTSPAPPPSKQPPATAIDWTNEQVLKFIELYKAETMLWDPTDKYYKDRCISADRWEILRSAFCEAAQIPRITIPELKRKRNSLMATYKSMLSKKKRAMEWRSGPYNDYQNWFAYHALDSFLGQNNECESDTERRANDRVPEPEPISSVARTPRPAERISQPRRTNVRVPEQISPVSRTPRPAERICEPRSVSARMPELVSPVSRTPRPAERICEPRSVSGRVPELVSPVSRTPRPAERICEPRSASGRVRVLISPVCRTHRPPNRFCEPIKVTSGPAPDWEPLITEIRDPLTTEVSDPLRVDVKSESELEQSDPELEQNEPELEQSDPELEQSDPEPEPVCKAKTMTQPVQVAPHVKEAMEKAARDNAILVHDQTNKINNLSKLCRHLRTRVKSYKQLVRRRDKAINGLREEIKWLKTQIKGKETQAGSNKHNITLTFPEASNNASNNGSNNGNNNGSNNGNNNVENKRDAPRIEVIHSDVSTKKPQRRPLINYRPQVLPGPRHIQASPAGFQRTSDIRHNSLVIQIDGQHNTVLQPKLVRINDVDALNKIR